MEQVVFDNEYFEKWLDEKCAEILQRIQSEKLSTEDMVLLCLKAQTNHFHHMDGEFRDEFKSIKSDFQAFKLGMKKSFEEIDKRFEEIDKRFEKIEQRLDRLEHRLDKLEQRFDEFQKRVDKRFDRQNYVMMWGFALFITTQMAILFK
jgi:hypothetical protein